MLIGINRIYNIFYFEHYIYIYIYIYWERQRQRQRENERKNEIDRDRDRDRERERERERESLIARLISMAIDSWINWLLSCSIFCTYSILLILFLLLLILLLIIIIIIKSFWSHIVYWLSHHPSLLSFSRARSSKLHSVSTYIWWNKLLLVTQN